MVTNKESALDTQPWSPYELIPFGAYVLLDRISVGASAAVYRAKRLAAGAAPQLVAIKRILPHMAGDPEFVSTFVEEAKIIGQLQHPNICPIYELGRVGESLYMAMEYVAGKDLGTIARDLTDRDKVWPRGVPVYVVSQLCRALHYAHCLRDGLGQQNGIVHRDLSPANVLVGYDGQIKLIDFGVAKAVGRAQQTHVEALKKKLGYMSPEMVKGHTIDARSDVFGAGVLLYEMVTGHRLFNAADDISTLKLVGSAVVTPPAELDVQVQQGLEAIMMRALQREPLDRYQSALEMAEALDDELTDKASYSPAAMRAFMQSMYADAQVQEQSELKLLLAAAADQEVLAERRRFFSSFGEELPDRFGNGRRGVDAEEDSLAEEDNALMALDAVQQDSSPPPPVMHGEGREHDGAIGEHVEAREELQDAPRAEDGDDSAVQHEQKHEAQEPSALTAESTGDRDTVPDDLERTLAPIRAEDATAEAPEPAAGENPDDEEAIAAPEHPSSDSPAQEPAGPGDGLSARIEAHEDVNHEDANHEDANHEDDAAANGAEFDLDSASSGGSAAAEPGFSEVPVAVASADAETDAEAELELKTDLVEAIPESDEALSGEALQAALAAETVLMPAHPDRPDFSEATPTYLEVQDSTRKARASAFRQRPEEALPGASPKEEVVAPPPGWYTTEAPEEDEPTHVLFAKDGGVTLSRLLDEVSGQLPLPSGLAPTPHPPSGPAAGAGTATFARVGGGAARNPQPRQPPGQRTTSSQWTTGVTWPGAAGPAAPAHPYAPAPPQRFAPQPHSAYPRRSDPTLGRFSDPTHGYAAYASPPLHHSPSHPIDDGLSPIPDSMHPHMLHDNGSMHHPGTGLALARIPLPDYPALLQAQLRQQELQNRRDRWANRMMITGLFLLSLSLIGLLWRTPLAEDLGLVERRMATIEIRTLPDVAASVRVDNVLRGSAPLRLSELPAGQHHIEIDAPGYEPVTREVALEPGTAMLLELSLLPELENPTP